MGKLLSYENKIYNQVQVYITSKPFSLNFTVSKNIYQPIFWMIKLAN